MEILVVPIFLFSGVFLFFCLLQCYICKNFKDKRVGLILPVGSFLIAIMPIISSIFGIISSIFSSSDENNVNSFIITLIPDANILLLQIFSYLIVLIVVLTPPIIFMLIYLYYKRKLNNKL